MLALKKNICFSPPVGHGKVRAKHRAFPDDTNNRSVTWTMQLDLYMLGTGGAFAKRYANNNALLSVNGFTLLVDCGITAPQKLHEAGIATDALGGVLITHLHGDHVGGLEELAFRMRYLHGRKLRLYLAEALIGPIWEHTLRGGMENHGEGALALTDYFDVFPLREYEPSELTPGLTIELLPTRHIPQKPSYALLVNDQWFFSSDSVFDRALLERLYYTRGCTHLLHECQLAGEGIVHTTLAELLTLPEEIQRAIWLMHYGDDMESFQGRTGAMQFLRQQEHYSFSL